MESEGKILISKVPPAPAAIRTPPCAILGEVGIAQTGFVKCH